MEPKPINKSETRLVWTVEEAGRLLGISRAHAYELVARGELPHLRLGRRVVVPKHAIEALLARAGSRP
jgi:excisionase family DNA binding protein